MIKMFRMFPTRRWSGRGLIVVLGIVVLVLVAAACNDDGPTPTANPPTPTVSSSSQISTDSGSEPNVKETTSPISFENLDADTIVAAQEVVLNRIYETLLPSVVHIRVPTGEGSGFVWDDQGHIVTNHHVVAGANRIVVILADDTEVDAEFLGSDPDSDLAALEVNLPSSVIPPVTLGDSAALKVGQLSLAIGNPFGQEFTLTSGIVSALGRVIRSGNTPFSIPEVIQSDTPINPGNSGGPLLDRHGRVIGITTQNLSSSGANSGIGFSVPINTAKRVVPALIEQGRFEHAWLGISGVSLNRDLTEAMGLRGETRGALVIDVASDSPADDAGLRGSDRTVMIEGNDFQVGGDVIVAIESSPIEGLDDLIGYLNANTRPGDTVMLEIIRGDNERVPLDVTLGSRPISRAFGQN